MLIDSRRGVMDSDNEMMSRLNEMHLPFQVNLPIFFIRLMLMVDVVCQLIFTKSDQVNEGELHANLHQSFVALSRQRGTSMCFPYIHVVSAVKGSGMDQLRLAIGGIYGNKNREVLHVQAEEVHAKAPIE